MRIGSMSLTAVVSFRQWILRIVVVCSVINLSLGKSSIAVDYQFVNYNVAAYSLAWPDPSPCGFPPPPQRKT